MKKILILYLLLQINRETKAQFTTIADGPEFKEPEKGAAKILQLKNGNTVYLHFRDGIHVQLYNAAHERIQDKKIFTIHAQNVAAVFETQGNVVVFAGEREAKHPVLYRFILDGKDGSLKKEEVVLHLDQLQLSASAPDFRIVKDPYTEYYAIKTWLNDTGGSEIIHYNPDHEVLSRGVFDKQVGEQFFHGFRDMVVLGDKAVGVLADNFHSNNRTELLILEKRNNTFKAIPLADADKGAMVKYNPVTDQLLILQGTKLSILNALTKETEQVKEVSMEGLPQNILIGENGSFRIVVEEVENVKLPPAPHAVTPSVHAILRNLTIIQLDSTGTQTGRWTLPKQYGIRGKHFEPFYQKKFENAATVLQEGEQYLYAGMAGDHILINEAKDRRRKVVWMPTNCMGAYYTMKKVHALSAPAPVFRKDYLGLFAGADYDAVNKVYAVLSLSPVKGNKKVKLSWLKIE